MEAVSHFRILLFLKVEVVLSLAQDLLISILNNSNSFALHGFVELNYSIGTRYNRGELIAYLRRTMSTSCGQNILHHHAILL